MSQYLKPQPEKLRSKIKHIVVLMLENRSFDNLLGWLYDDEEVPNDQSFEGLTEDLWNPLDNIDSDGNSFIEKVPIAKSGFAVDKNGKRISADFSLPNPDPGEGYADTNHQLFGKYKVGALYPPKPVNLGFVQNYNNAMLYSSYQYGDTPTDPRKIMTCYTPRQTPVLSTLAKNFAVCDQYFASVPSQTLPNRSFVHAATSDGSVNNTPNAFCDSKTIFNQIEDAIEDGNDKLSWGIFGNNIFSHKTQDKPGKFGKNHFSLTRLAMKKLHHRKFNKNFATLDGFYECCSKDKLPSYSFLEPNFAGPDQNDQHPSQDIRPGEKLIADVYNAVKESKSYKETLLIITYDEHGGCYDHVPPPSGAMNPDHDDAPGQDGFRFNRFGVRVPCVLVNPYIPKGLVARPYGYTPFDHTSVIKTVQNCLGLRPHLTSRSDAAPDFSCVLQLPKHRSRRLLPKVQPYRGKSILSEELNELHRLMATMIGELTGKKKPHDRKLLDFVQKNYDAFFAKSQD